MKAWTPMRSASAVVRVSKSSRPAWATVDADRSMPAQKASPVPVISNDRTPGSARTARTVSRISSRISTVSAFFASGRSSVMRQTWSVPVSTLIMRFSGWS
jgi:hypothetical protein